MWSDSDGEKELTPNEMGPGRMSTSSEVVMVDERAVSEVPSIAQLNVSHKSKVHLGPKFVSVTQNVNNAEMVKNVALPCYLWQLAKSTSRAERLWCLAALAGVVGVMALIIYYSRPGDPPEDIAPHEWNITREMWLAQKYETVTTTTPYEPLRLVIVQHTVSQECHRFAACAAELRTLQAWNIRDCPCDIAYNFVIGNEGRVYEGRGWRKVGAHTAPFNRCSVGLGFIGDYRSELIMHSKVTELQMNRTMRLLNYGVEKGYLHPDYYIIAAMDVSSTASPGSNLYEALKKLKNFHNGQGFRNRQCDEIYAEFKAASPVEHTNNTRATANINNTDSSETKT